MSIRVGDKFRGTQKSGRNAYPVQVEIKINGLTQEYPVLTTYFEGEIVGNRHSFLTRKWDADEAVDRQHWAKFPTFSRYERQFNDDNFSLDFMKDDCLFMRWKEHFLVPDHRVVTINGASFAGFYYVCFEKSTGNIAGYYYHNSSEWFQSLQLERIPTRSFGHFDFR